MKYFFTTRFFLENDAAVSEEFTVLPALSIVMIGFSIFTLLLAQTYIVTMDNLERLQHYQTADRILQRITNSESVFISQGGCINLQTLQSDNGFLEEICKEYKRSGICFLLRLAYNNYSMDFPKTPPERPVQCTAVSKEVPIYLNEAQTIPGRLSIVLWRDME